MLIFTLSAYAFSVQLAYSHSPPWTIPTWTYCTVSSSTIGINQDQLIVFWMDEPPPTAHGIYGDRWTFTLEVTDPDGTKQALGPFTSDPVGGGWSLYKPTKLGKYSVIAKFEEHTITGLPMNPTRTMDTINGASWVNDTYQSSVSDPATFIVQQEQIQPWQEPPLPTEYWTRPINSMNRNWYQIAGNWLGLDSGAQDNGPTTYFGYGLGPESAHVMWAKSMWTGGIMDARFGDTGFQTAHYEGISLNPPIILDGKIYYNVLSNPREGWYCLDLYTGETLYFKNTTGPVIGAGLTYSINNEGQRIPYLESHGSIRGGSLSFGQIYNYGSVNQHGGFPYLWSIYGPNGEANTWQMFDAFSGNYICSIANVSAAGTTVYGQDGSILKYNIVGSGANKRLTVWNNTYAIWYDEVYLGHEYALWRPTLDRVFDGRNGFSLNVSIPDVQGSIRSVREGKYVIGGTEGKNNGSYIQMGNMWTINLDPSKGAIGSLLENITFTPPETMPDTVMAGASTGWNGQAKMVNVDPEDGVFLFWEPITRKWYCYSLETGLKMWESQPEHPFNFYSLNAGGIATCTKIYQGKLFSTGYGGVLVAYDIQTGTVLWNYTATNVGYESPYGNYPLGIGVVADGKLYLGSGEHSPSQPLWRGSCIRCINASNGAELWKMSHWGIYLHGDHTGSKLALGDGYLVGLNLYDNRIYCYGKGPSATTVTVSSKVAAKGSSVLIEGTVTDQSSGAKGTPAIADVDQQVWMEYLYAQQAKPENAKGVQVHLTAIDPNGNFQDIGTVTSDAGGLFKKGWIPPVEGEYTILAEFEGSKAYYTSSAETALLVSSAPSPAITTPVPPQTVSPTQSPIPPTTVSPSPTEAVQPPPSAMPTETYIVIGAAVIIIVVVAATLVLRRRKQ